ncbi:hypothetical protein QBC39DRAFT_382669 [Podospora conica]|nr:hypothetical protein QBC39DRAFT_382669 [Schizothecium conicum]
MPKMGPPKMEPYPLQFVTTELRWTPRNYTSSTMDEAGDTEICLTPSTSDSTSSGFDTPGTTRSGCLTPDGSLSSRRSAFNPFTGKITIEPHNQALRYGQLASCSQPPTRNPNPFGPHHLILWSDGSWIPGPASPKAGVTPPKAGAASKKAGMGVAYRPHPASPWRESAYAISSSRHGRESFCELLAIEAALGIAKTTVESRKKDGGGTAPAITRVTVFSDARSALEAIVKPRKAGDDRFARGAAYAAALGALGVEVELRWVPGHSGVEGNVRADAVAKLARIWGPDPSGKGDEVPESPTVMRLSVPVLRGFKSVLEMLGRMVGAAAKRRGEGKVAGLLAEAAREEGKVAGLLAEASREEGWVIVWDEEGMRVV